MFKHVGEKFSEIVKGTFLIREPDKNRKESIVNKRGYIFLYRELYKGDLFDTIFHDDFEFGMYRKGKRWVVVELSSGFTISDDVYDKEVVKYEMFDKLKSYYKHVDKKKYPTQSHYLKHLVDTVRDDGDKLNNNLTNNLAWEL